MEQHIIDDEELNFYLLLNDYVEEKGHLIKNTKIKFSMKTYKVKSGDSLLGISKNFGIRMNLLRNINGLKSTKIYVGQVQWL